jgi:hypothetical protein
MLCDTKHAVRYLFSLEVCMKNLWFRRCGWVYRPVSWQGLLLVVAATLFCWQVFRAIDRHSHSASDTLFNVFPYFASCFLLLNWVAANTSRGEQK